MNKVLIWKRYGQVEVYDISNDTKLVMVLERAIHVADAYGWFIESGNEIPLNENDPRETLYALQELFFHSGDGHESFEMFEVFNVY